jgi:hypothetical protein
MVGKSQKERCGFYRCRCGLEISVYAYHHVIKCARCTISPTGYHVFNYINQDGMPSLRGSIHS